MEIYRNPELLTYMNRFALRILEYGDVDADTTWQAQGVCSSFSRLYLVTGGEGILHREEGDVLLLPGHAYLIPAGLRYSYGTSTHLHKLFFHFNLVRPDGYDYFHRFGKVADVPLSLQDAEELRLLFYGKGIFSDAIITKLYISRILSEILSAYPYCPTDAEGFSARTATALSYIGEHLSATLMVREVANALFVSEGTLTGNFKREVGCSVSRYIEDRVLQVAEEKLVCTDNTIGEIAAACGFCDPFYFSRRFHAVYGMSPTHYRQALRAETSRN